MLNLAIPEHIEPLRAKVLNFIEQEVYPLETELLVDKVGSRRGEVLRSLMDKAKSEGLWALGHPEEIGGGGLPFMDYVFINEVVGRSEIATVALGTHSLQDSIMLNRYASDEWRDKYLKPLVDGEVFPSFGMTEPDVASSDPTQLQTRAVLEGDEWVINGQKTWTSGARNADYMFCLVRTEPDQPKHAGISYLLFDMKQPGVDVRPLKQMTGATDFNEVFLTDVRTPKDWIVGKRGEGWLVSRTTLKHERNSIGAAAQSSAMFAGLLHLAKSTSKNGRPNIEDPTVRQRLAEIEGYVKSHEYSGFRQMTRNARNEDVGIIQLMNKLNSTNIGSRVSTIALDILGDEGLLDPDPGDKLMVRPNDNRGWIAQYMYSLGIAVAGGTANIQRNVIGERGLGLPRDFAADRSSAK